LAVRSIGGQELALLRHIADRGGATVGEVVAQFGTERRLARSTVLTMMERLRQKGHLDRRLADGVFRYRTRTSSAELLHGAVSRFVERHLGGSVAPLVAYLQESADLSEADRREIEQLLETLQSSRKEEPR
jgi:predicted transcriptional regulator